METYIFAEVDYKNVNRLPCVVKRGAFSIKSKEVAFTGNLQTNHIINNTKTNNQ